jgi:hypothetical protein
MGRISSHFLIANFSKVRVTMKLILLQLLEVIFFLNLYLANLAFFFTFYFHTKFKYEVFKKMAFFFHHFKKYIKG